MKFNFFWTGIFIFLLSSCGSKDTGFLPKPKGYNRLDLPEHAYQQLSLNLPYTFEYSKAAIVIPDASAGAEPNWIVVEYPNLDAKVQFTYKPLHGNLKKLDEHVADAYKLASKHQVKATSQVESVVKLKTGYKAVIIELEGEVPSHYQFYLTDTTNHYLRGVAYLKRATLNDSLLPLVNYLKQDCRHMLETLKWKNK